MRVLWYSRVGRTVAFLIGTRLSAGLDEYRAVLAVLALVISQIVTFRRAQIWVSKTSRDEYETRKSLHRVLSSTRSARRRTLASHNPLKRVWTTTDRVRTVPYRLVLVSRGRYEYCMDSTRSTRKKRVR